MKKFKPIDIYIALILFCIIFWLSYTLIPELCAFAIILSVILFIHVGNMIAKIS